MSSLLRWMLPAVAAAGLMLGVTTLKAADDTTTAKGSISGTVVDKDGKGVEGVTVNLMPPRMRGNRGGAGGGGAAGAPAAGQSALNHDAIGLQAQGGQGGGRGMPKPIQTAKSDKDGKFEMKDVPVGDYVVMVRDDDKKVYGRKTVKVEDGKEASVEIKTTDTPPARGGRGGAGGGGAAGGAGAKQ